MTRRETIATILKNRPGVRPSDLRNALQDEGIGLTPDEIIDEISEVAKSEDVFVEPPKCRDCNFDAFDNPANIPSQCPACRSEWLREPRFTIDEEA